MSEGIRIHKTEVKIRRKEQRINFWIALPSDVQEVIAVQALASTHPNHLRIPATNNWMENNAGLLSLRIRERADIFYQQKVDFEGSFSGGINSLHQASIPTGFSNSEFWTSGRKYDPTPISIGAGQPLIQGYYKDRINHRSGQDLEYTLSVYLYYHRKS